MIRVSAPSRLHMGILAPAEVENVRFGSIGVAIDAYRTVVLAERSEKREIYGMRAEDAKKFADVLSNKFKIEGYRVDILNAAPEHVGLGSSTQLALSVCSAISKLYKLDLDAVEMSKILGRGKVSGIGTLAFKHGGFIVEKSLKLVSRVDFPKDWKFVVAIPEGKGLYGRVEDEAFRTLKPKPQLTYKACFLVLMKILPSLISRDFEGFTLAIEELQKLVGEMFLEAQGGIYCEKTSEVVEVLKSFELKGVGQSSWGPAAYGLVLEKDAFDKYDDVKGSFKGKVVLCSADNSGAVIEYVDR